MTPLRTLAAALLLAGLPVAAAQEDGGAYAELDGVPYLFAHGGLAGSAMARGAAHDGQPRLGFQGCAFAQLRPELDHGRLRVAGLLDGTLLTLESEEFAGPPPFGGVAAEAAMDDGRNPPTPIAAGAWGTVRAWAGGKPLPDPVGGGPLLQAAFFVTGRGFRDDATGAVLRPDGSPWSPGAGKALSADDAEAHLRLFSPPGAAPTGDAFTLAAPGDLPDGRHSLDGEHRAALNFTNTRYGGQATARITATSAAPPTLTELSFSFVSPTGEEVANETVRASVGLDGRAEASFPLDRLGDYRVLVRGRLALADYRVEVELAPPEGFDLTLWWEDVALGPAARGGMDGCVAQLGPNGAVPAPSSVGRPAPPAYPLEAVAVATLAGATAVLLGAKLVADTLSGLAFRRRFRR